MGEIIAARFSRRGLLKGALAVSAISATVSPLALLAADRARAAGDLGLLVHRGRGRRRRDAPRRRGLRRRHAAALGRPALRRRARLRPDGADAPTRRAASSATTTTSSATSRSRARRSTACSSSTTNTPNPHLMFPGIVTIVEKEGKKAIEAAPLTKEQVDIEMAAHGGTIVEIRKVDGKWQVVKDSPYNRRITADDRDGDHRSGRRPRPDCRPAPTDRHEGARHDQQLRRRRDALGHLRHGEENFHGYFSGELPADHPEAARYKRYGVPEGAYEWANFYDRFDVAQGAERAEPLRLDRRDRSARRELDAEEAHRARPLQARGRRIRSSPRTAASSSISATTSASTTSTSS